MNRIGRWSEANGTISEILSYLITETMRPEEEKTWGLPPIPFRFPPMSQS